MGKHGHMIEKHGHMMGKHGGFCAQLLLLSSPLLPLPGARYYPWHTSIHACMLVIERVIKKKNSPLQLVRTSAPPTQLRATQSR